MEQKSITKRKVDASVHEATSDAAQELWEKKLLGNDPAHVAKSSFYKGNPNASNVYIKIPASMLNKLKPMADHEGMRCEDYILHLIGERLKKK